MSCGSCFTRNTGVCRKDIQWVEVHPQLFEDADDSRNSQRQWRTQGGGHGGHGPPRNVSEWPSNINRIILYNLLPSLFTKYNKWYDVLFIVVKYCYNIISIFLFFSANLVIISSVCRWIERS